MSAPITPFVGVDAFVLNEKHEVCLVKRRDNGLWAMPGGYHNLGETPSQCAEREVAEETGLHVRVTSLLGVFSSLCHRNATDVNRGRQLCYLLFSAERVGGTETSSDETTDVSWFSMDNLPDLSDGHSERLEIGFDSITNANFLPHFE